MWRNIHKTVNFCLYHLRTIRLLLVLRIQAYDYQTTQPNNIWPLHTTELLLSHVLRKVPNTFKKEKERATSTSTLLTTPQLCWYWLRDYHKKQNTNNGYQNAMQYQHKPLHTIGLLLSQLWEHNNYFHTVANMVRFIGRGNKSTQK